MSGKDDPQIISNFWSIPEGELLGSLQSASHGLSEKAAQQRLQQYGVNSIKPRRADPLVWIFLKQFKSPITIILIVAAILSFFLEGKVDALIILFIILASSMLSFWQEKGATDAVNELMNIVQIHCRTKRNDNIIEIPVEQIVPGDIVVLQAGDTVPGDSRILESNVLYVDEAAFTGETFPVEKNVGVMAKDTQLSGRSNSLLMGSHVVSGSATVLVVNTGHATELGKISQQLSTATVDTEFERGVKKFGYLLSEVTLVLVIIIFGVNVFLQKPVLDALLFSLAIAVGLTPQLLPAIISVNLSRGAKRMAQQHVIVKRLASIENFGSMDVLCSDKTGTLTEGRVKVQGTWDYLGRPSTTVSEFAYVNASLQHGFKNPIDDSIIENHLPNEVAYVRLSEVPYDFIRKRLTILAQRGTEQIIISKGALKNILEICTQVVGADGRVQPIDPLKPFLLDSYKAYSAKGLRTLGIAYKPARMQTIQVQDESEMIFAGFITLFDPPKEGIGQTIKKLNELGVSLKIITGDNALVAMHVGEQIGIKDLTVVTGAEMHHTSDAALLDKVQKAYIFAEVEPNQKERIIMALQRCNHVVGYMGDGINDASALLRSDIGISVDSAVDVAKGSADIILLNKDLRVLINGVREGRKTFANTLKYVFMATSANFGNMFSVAGASLFLPFLPLLPKQILLANTLTDLPELAIASDRVDDAAVLNPHRWNISFIRKFMLAFGLLSSVFDYLTFGALLWIGADQREFETAWFVESVVSAASIVLIVRTQGRFYASKPGTYLLLATAFIVLLVCYIPFSPFASALGFVPLPLSLLLVIGLIVIVYAGSAEILKKWFYSKNKL